MKNNTLRRAAIGLVTLAMVGVIVRPQGVLGQLAGQTSGGAAHTTTAPVPATRPSVGAPVTTGRRDLFAPPPGVATGAHAGSTGAAVPSMPGPQIGSISLPPLPGAVGIGPASAPPALSGQGGQGTPTAPTIELRGVALGRTPQAVLVSGGTYAIVTVGQKTDWGTVTGITATTVTLRMDSGSRTLRFETPHPAATTQTGSH